MRKGAQSTAAAQGLAQIIPDTGHWIAEQLGHPEYTNEIIYRPVVNLRFGAYYLDWVRDYLDGNLLSALVGYNAGPGNAKSWREQAGSDDTIFAEILTFSEPRVLHPDRSRQPLPLHAPVQRLNLHLLLRAMRFECFVESDSALRNMPVERQGEEDLLWDSLKHKSRHVAEPESPVVLRMSHETTSLRVQFFQL